jgi:hypothetical protein
MYNGYMIIFFKVSGSIHRVHWNSVIAHYKVIVHINLNTLQTGIHSLANEIKSFIDFSLT